MPKKTGQIHAVTASGADGTVESHSIELTTTADMRRHSRVDALILAEVFTESGESTIGLITDISLSGLRLEGGREMLDTLMPNCRRINQHIPAPVRVHFELPSHETLNATAQVLTGTAYTRRLDKDTYHVGMHFIDIQEGADSLKNYLANRGAL